jgi:hypothetical protein
VRNVSQSQLIDYLIILACFLLFLILYAAFLGFGAIGGVAAIATFAHMEGIAISSSMLGSGALGGVVITIVFHIQVLATALTQREGGGYLPSILIWLDVGFNLVFLHFGPALLRTFLTAVTLALRFNLQSEGPYTHSITFLRKQADL